MPNSESEMKQYLRNTNYKFMNEILEKLEPAEMVIQLPKFRFECTSRAEKALGKVCTYYKVFLLASESRISLNKHYLLFLFLIQAWDHDTFYIES